MAPLFAQIGSGKIEHYCGRVIKDLEQAGGRFSAYYNISVSVDQRPKADGEQYAPSLIIQALTSDDSIGKGDKVVIQGTLQSNESNGKTYYKFNPFVVLPTVVVEKAGQSATAATTKSATVKRDEVDDDSDF